MFAFIPTPPRDLWAGVHPRTPLGRARLTLLVGLIILTAGAWLLTIHQAQTMDMPMGVVPRDASVAPDPTTVNDDMRGMAMDDAADMAATGMAGTGWSLAGLVAFVVAWAVMMAAMMFPAAAPMLLLFRRVSAQRGTRGPAFVPTWIFAAGYLLVWAAVGGLTWLVVQVGGDLAGRLGETERATWAPLALGTVLAVAGFYQFTPLKAACLGHCQSPVGFVMTHWRDGHAGALRMGIVHGAFCLGCCWALFAVLVAAGVMSLAWMHLLTLVVFAEKVLPVGPRTVQVTGMSFLLLGVLVAAGIAPFPWTA